MATTSEQTAAGAAAVSSVPAPRPGSPAPRSLAGLPYADPGVPDLRSGDRLLWWLARTQQPLLWRGIAYGVVWMGAQACVPAALGAGVQAAADREESRVLTWAAVVLALGLVQALAGVMRHRMGVANWIAASSRVQQVVARQAATLGADLPRQVATGEVVAVTANDVERIGSAFDVVIRFAGAVVAFVGVATVLVIASPLLGAVVLIGMPLLTMLVLPLMGPLERRETAQRASYGTATELASDTVSGLRVLRGIGGEELFLDRFREASQQVRRASIHTNDVRSLIEALQVALPGIFVVAVTYLGARLALDGTLDVGQLVAFYGYSAFLVLPLRTLTETADKVTRARVAARRIVRVSTLEREHGEPSEPATEPAEGVGLHDSRSGITVVPGQLTAIVCGDPDAAGRLVDRLGGYHDDFDDVTLGTVPLRELPVATVRRRILVQDKDPMILSGTLAELFAVPGSGRVAVSDAVTAAAADDVIEGLGGDPEAYASLLPERGRTLSGGQRQRLSLARSLVADPDVLVLDEPTSAVDSHTEAAIAARLRDVRAGRTTVVLSTSPLLLEQADVVVFAPEGVALATGRHRALLAESPAYRAVVTREDSP